MAFWGEAGVKAPGPGLWEWEGPSQRPCCLPAPLVWALHGSPSPTLGGSHPCPCPHIILEGLRSHEVKAQGTADLFIPNSHSFLPPCHALPVPSVKVSGSPPHSPGCAMSEAQTRRVTPPTPTAHRGQPFRALCDPWGAREGSPELQMPVPAPSRPGPPELAENVLVPCPHPSLSI